MPSHAISSVNRLTLKNAVILINAQEYEAEK